MIRQKGPPTLFFSGSFADLRIDLLKEILGITDDDNLYKEIKNNPHIADKFFTESFKNFMDIVFIKALGAKHFFIRFEYTHRGKIHCHGFLWLEEPGPGLKELGEVCKKGKIAEISFSMYSLTYPVRFGGFI